MFALPLGDQTCTRIATRRCQSATRRRVLVNHLADCLFSFGSNGHDRRDCLHRVMRLVSEILLRIGPTVRPRLW